EERSDLLTLAAGSPLAAVRLQAQGVREQRAQAVEGVKKLLKQQISPSQLAESWNALPLNLLFDWFCDWAQLMLRYQLTRDEAGLGQADMRKVVQYLADKTAQAKVLAIQEWLLAQRQKVIGKANLNRVLLLEALLVQWAALPGSDRRCWTPADSAERHILLAVCWPAVCTRTCTGPRIRHYAITARNVPMSLPPNLGPRNGILSLTIKDKSVLYAAYMPFIKNGGLFIPTNKSYK